MNTPTPVTLFICRTCGYKQVKNPDGTPADNPTSHELVQRTQAALQAHHPEAAPHITVKLSTCLSVCHHGIAWGLRAEDRYAYTLAHAPTTATAGEDLATTAVAYLNTRPGAKIPKADMPESVRPNVVSKLPPIS